MERELESKTEGFTLLDLAALVVGAAVAAVHLREAIPNTLASPGWVLMWLAFSGVALTAAGPCVFLVRWFGRRPPRYPRLGDRLWALLGLPWVLTVVLRSGTPRADSNEVHDLYTMGLMIGLGIVIVVTLAVVWSRWVMVPPGRIESEEPDRSWTHRVGLTLAVAWPLQFAFGLLVLGPPA